MKKRKTLAESSPLRALRAVCMAAATLALGACTHDVVDEPERPDDGDLDVRLNLIIPGGNAATRAISGTEENNVQAVDVLAFEVSGGTENFIYSATGTLVSGQGTNTQTYSAPLQVSDKLQRLVIITNARQEVDALLGSSTAWKGTEKSTMLSQLRVNLTGDRWNANSASDYKALPMWGESASQVITAQTTTLAASLSLLRMVARVDVQLSGAATSKFKLKSVGLYNTNTGGRVVPDAANLATRQESGTTYTFATAPTIPTDLQPYTARHKGPITYTDFTSPGSTDVAMRGAIYTFETPAGVTDQSQATCLIIGGLYDTDTTPTYYRVDFIEDATKNRLALLRNWLYTINITGVNVRGHATPDEAFNSTAINMNANIIQWNDAQMRSIIYDGDVYLTVGNNNLLLYKNAYSAGTASGDNVVPIETNATGGWTVEKIVDGSDNAVTWLNIHPNTGAANAVTNTYVSTEQNTGTADRTAYIWIKAGSIRYAIKVTQSGSQVMPTALHLTDSHAVDITELSFLSAADVTPAAQELHVYWTPPNFNLNVASAQEANSSAAFPSGSGQPTDGEVIAAGSGHKIYTIAPPAIKQSELDANPFLLKSSKIDVSLNDGSTTTTRTVMLRQMVPNIQIVNKANYYLVNGSSGSFGVRSNVNWIIKSVTEHQNQTYADRRNTAILSNKPTDNMVLGYTGAPNTSANGTSVNFTTSSQIGKWGTIDVVIGSPDSPAKFADRTVTLVMAAPALRLYTIGGTGGTEGAGRYNIGDGNYNSAKMFVATRNFGPTATSTVICEPISATGMNYDDLRSGGGNHTLTTAEVQAAIDAGAYALTISGNLQWGDDVSVMIKRNFLDNNRPVFINIQHYDTQNSMMKACFGQIWMNSIPMMYNQGYETNSGATYLIQNNSDPVLVGPFGDTRGKYWGQHWVGAHGIYDVPENVFTRMSNFVNQSGNTSNTGADVNRLWIAFRLKQMPLFWIADEGFARSDNPSGTDVSPFYVDANYVPAVKSYGTGTRRDIYNSHIVANFIAWCVARNPAQ